MHAGSPSHDADIRRWCAELDRIHARPVRTTVTRGGCRRFERDSINPEAGMGACRLGQGMWHPMAGHWCREWEAA